MYWETCTAPMFHSVLPRVKLLLFTHGPWANIISHLQRRSEKHGCSWTWQPRVVNFSQVLETSLALFLWMGWWVCSSESGETLSFLAPWQFFSFSLSLVLFPFVMMWRMENASQDLEIIIYVRSLVCRLPSAYKYVISLGRFLQQSVRQAGQVVSFTFQKVSSWILKRWRTEGRLEIRPNY